MLLLLAVACGPAPAGDGDSGDSGTDSVGTDSAVDSAETAETAESADSETAETGPEADQDGDGHPDIAAGGDDCDDADPAVHPGAEEVCADGVDNDCDGAAPGCRLTGELAMSEGWTHVQGTPLAGYLGTGALLDDLTGDGVDDLALSSFTTLSVFPGPVPAIELLDTDADIRIGGFGHLAAMASGDVDGDGALDVAVGDPWVTSGVAVLFLGPLSYGTVLTDAVGSVVGERTSDGVGGALAFGDVDGDAVDDLVLGDALHPLDADNYEAGAAYLFLDPPTGDLDTTSADVTLLGDAGGSWAGRRVLAGEDLDGDGLGDVALSAPGFESPRAAGGAVHVCTELVLGVSDAQDCAATLRGEDGAEAGWTLGFAGDADGDGLVDLAIGAPGVATADGAIRVVYSPTLGTSWLDAADAAFVGNGERLGAGAVLGLGDVDGDGFDDLAFSSPTELADSGGAGITCVAYGPFAGTTPAADCPLRLFGDGSERGYVYQDELALGDGDHDGLPDLLIASGFLEGGNPGEAWMASLDPK